MKRIGAKALEGVVEAIFKAKGANPAQAAATARHMVWCEMVGRANFGIERIAIHVKRIEAGVLDPSAELSSERIAPTCERIDGGSGFGYRAAEYAMARAIAIAREQGVGAAGVRNSNFFGAGAYYVNLAAEAGMIGLAMSNSFPKVAAHGGLKPVLGTNPLAFGAPRASGEHLLIDMATSALAGSTVREAIAKGNPLPEGLAIDAEGRPLTDPTKASEGALLPFGGAKGFGLSLMVELLAGVLTGAGVGAGVASMYNDFTRAGDNGHFLLALDIERFLPLSAYHARFESLVAALKSSGDVLLPGEVRWENYRRANAEGITVDAARWAEVSRIAAATGIAPP